MLLGEEHFHLIALEKGSKTEHLIGCSLQEAELPTGILVAMIWRDGIKIVPGGDTVMMDGDYLTIIGSLDDLQLLRQRYEED